MTLNVQNAKEIKILQSKNLLDMYGGTWSIASGTTVTESDGVFHMQQSGTGLASARLQVNGLEQGKEYTISFQAKGVVINSNQNNTYVRVREGSGSGTWVSLASDKIAVSNDFILYTLTFTATSVSNPWIWFYLSDSANNTNSVDIYVKNVQLESGAEATAYTPYVAPSEVRAIHDKDSRLLWGRLEYDTKYEGDAWQQTYTGKNLFNKDTTPKTTSGTSVTVLDTGIRTTVTLAGNYRHAFIVLGDISQYAGRAIIMSAKIAASGDNVPRLSFGICKSDGSDTLVRRTLDVTGSTGSYTPSAADLADRPYLFVYAYSNLNGDSAAVGDYVDYTDVQIEVNSTATTYEPYVGGIPAPNPDYPQDIKVVQGPQKITVRGKNKFSLDYYGTYYYGQTGSMTVTHSDTYASMKAITTSGAQYVRTTIDGFDPAKTYRVSCKGKKIVKGTNGQPYLRLYVTCSDDNINWGSSISDTVYDPVQGQEYTLATTISGHAYYRFYFYNNSNTPVTIGEETEYWDIQIEEGNTTTTFEAFQAKTINTDLRGVNLIGLASIVGVGHCQSATLADNKIAVVPDGVGNPQITVQLSSPIPAGTYKLNSSTFLSNSTQLRDTHPGGHATYNFGGSYSNISFTTTETSKYIMLNFINPGNTDPFTVDLTTLQIEAGSTATAYQPYHAPYEMKRVSNYSDYIYKDGNDWKLKTQVGKVMFSGGSSEYWTKLNLAFQTVVTDNKGSQINSAYSDYYSYYPAQSAITSNIGNGQFGWNTTNNLTIRNDSCADATAFKSWLQSHNTSVYYNLATPTDTVITDAVLIEKLNSIHDWLNRYGYHADVVGDLPIVINQESL